MKVLQAVTIENFQSHRKTALELGPGLTVLVGPSDSGKTALIRALRWVLFNEPQGFGFLRVGAEQARVTIVFADGTRVVRERGKSFNRYRVSTTAELGKEVTLEGFGTEVPTEVLAATGTVKAGFAGVLETAVGFSYQLDGPFLLSETAGTAARVLGKLAGTEIVDRALKDLGTDTFRARQQEKSLEATLADLDERIKGYAHLPDLENRITFLERLLEQVENLRQRRDILAGMAMRLRDVDEAIRENQARYDRLAFVSTLTVILPTLEAGDLRLATLNRLRRQLAEINQQADMAGRILHVTATIPALAGLIVTLEEADDRVSYLAALREQARTVSQRLVEAERVLAVVEPLSDVGRILSVVATAADRLARFRGVTAHLNRVNEQFGITETILAQTAFVPVVEELVTMIADRTGRREMLEQNRGRLGLAAARAAELKDQVAAWSRRVAKAENDYRALLAKSGTCPVCGNKISPERVKGVAV